MLLYPSVDELLEKVDSRYKLIALASKRARQLDVKSPATLENFDSVKTVGQALEEINAGNVVIDPESEK